MGDKGGIVVVCVKVDPDGVVVRRADRRFVTGKKAHIYAEAMIKAGYAVEVVND